MSQKTVKKYKRQWEKAKAETLAAAREQMYNDNVEINRKFLEIVSKRSFIKRFLLAMAIVFGIYSRKERKRIKDESRRTKDKA